MDVSRRTARTENPGGRRGLVGRCVEPNAARTVLLADGGLLAADSVALEKEGLTTEGESFGTQAVPRESLAGIVFHAPADRQENDALQDRIVSATGRSDRLLLLNGDELTGRLESLSGDLAKLETDLGPVEVQSDRIRAVVFSPTARRPTKADNNRLRAWVGLGDGSRLLAARLIVDGESATVDAAGQAWKTSRKQIVFLQPIGGRAVYLPT